MANSIASSGNFYSGSKTVTAAGTAEALDTTNTLFSAVLLVAKAANTGQVYVGGSDVDSSTNAGLDAGDSLEIEPSRGKGVDLSAIFIDVDTSAEGVDFYAVM